MLGPAAVPRVVNRVDLRAKPGDPARFTQFYDKVKNDPGWTVHTLPCTTFIQLEMPDELTAILLKAIPWKAAGPDRSKSARLADGPRLSRCGD